MGGRLSAKTDARFGHFYLRNNAKKISDKNLYSYNVYQIEGQGKNLFEKINGDKNTIMGLPILEIKKYLDNIK